jgi:hypothetical protein
MEKEGINETHASFGEDDMGEILKERNNDLFSVGKIVA